MPQDFSSWQVLLVDLRCHGDSARHSAASHRPDNGVESAAADVLDLLRHLKLFPEVLIGHSFGGKVVMSMADQFGRIGPRLPRPVQVRKATNAGPNVPCKLSQKAHFMTAFVQVLSSEIDTTPDCLAWAIGATVFLAAYITDTVRLLVLTGMGPRCAARCSARIPRRNAVATGSSSRLDSSTPGVSGTHDQQIRSAGVPVAARLLTASGNLGHQQPQTHSGGSWVLFLALLTPVWAWQISPCSPSLPI